MWFEVSFNFQIGFARGKRIWSCINGPFLCYMDSSKLIEYPCHTLDTYEICVRDVELDIYLVSIYCNSSLA